VSIDHYGRNVDGFSVSALEEDGFAYLKQFGATNVDSSTHPPSGYEETGSISREIPGLEIAAQTSTASNHTYEMEADNFKDVGHLGFTVDAQTMAAVLFDFVTQLDYRAAVKREFDGLKALFDEYQESLKKVYLKPTVP
jgi:hypothetical protein